MTRLQGTSIDLNLFVVFDAVYAEGSVTRASERLFLSQPAVSHALNRLRQLLDDPLFERRGKVMVPTPVAHRLIGGIREALDLLDGSVAGATRFDPATSTKRFTIGIRNHLEAVLVPGLTRHLAAVAPDVSVAVVRAERRELGRELATGLLDVAIDVLLPLDESIRRQLVHSAPLVVAARRGHPLLAGDLDLDAYLAADHVQVSSRRHGMSLEDFELSRQGLGRNVRLRCQTYPSAWEAVAGTDLLLTLPELYVHGLARGDDGVVVVDCPVELPLPEWHLYWHTNREQDLANAWIRSLLTDPGCWPDA